MTDAQLAGIGTLVVLGVVLVVAVAEEVVVGARKLWQRINR